MHGLQVAAAMGTGYDDMPHWTRMRRWTTTKMCRDQRAAGPSSDEKGERRGMRGYRRNVNSGQTLDTIERAAPKSGDTQTCSRKDPNAMMCDWMLWNDADRPLTYSLSEGVGIETGLPGPNYHFKCEDHGACEQRTSEQLRSFLQQKDKVKFLGGTERPLRRPLIFGAQSRSSTVGLVGTDVPTEQERKRLQRGMGWLMYTLPSECLIKERAQGKRRAPIASNTTLIAPWWQVSTCLLVIGKYQNFNILGR